MYWKYDIAFFSTELVQDKNDYFLWPNYRLNTRTTKKFVCDTIFSQEIQKVQNTGQKHFCHYTHFFILILKYVKLKISQHADSDSEGQITTNTHKAK